MAQYSFVISLKILLKLVTQHTFFLEYLPIQLNQELMRNINPQHEHKYRFTTSSTPKKIIRISCDDLIKQEQLNKNIVNSNNEIKSKQNFTSISMTTKQILSSKQTNIESNKDPFVYSSNFTLCPTTNKWPILRQKSANRINIISKIQTKRKTSSQNESDINRNDSQQNKRKQLPNNNAHIDKLQVQNQCMLNRGEFLISSNSCRSSQIVSKTTEKKQNFSSSKRKRKRSIFPAKIVQINLSEPNNSPRIKSKPTKYNIDYKKQMQDKIDKLTETLKGLQDQIKKKQSIQPNIFSSSLQNSANKTVLFQQDDQLSKTMGPNSIIPSVSYNNKISKCTKEVIELQLAKADRCRNLAQQNQKLLIRILQQQKQTKYYSERQGNQHKYEQISINKQRSQFSGQYYYKQQHNLCSPLQVNDKLYC